MCQIKDFCWFIVTFLRNQNARVPLNNTTTSVSQRHSIGAAIISHSVDRWNNLESVGVWRCAAALFIKIYRYLFCCYLFFHDNISWPKGAVVFASENCLDWDEIWRRCWPMTLFVLIWCSKQKRLSLTRNNVMLAIAMTKEARVCVSGTISG